MASEHPLKKAFVYLVGKTGSGKSSTGNTILRRKAFGVKSSLSAVTTELQREQTQLGQRLVEVVDSPGLVGVDGDLNHDVLQDISRLVQENAQCVHVFLLVCRYGERFSTEDCAVVAALKEEFGEERFNKDSILIITCGDNFAIDTEGEDLTFETWCSQQTGVFADLLGSLRGRVLLVNNAKKAEISFLYSLEELIDAVNANIYNAGYQDVMSPIITTINSIQSSACAWLRTTTTTLASAAYSYLFRIRRPNLK